MPGEAGPAVPLTRFPGFFSPIDSLLARWRPAASSQSKVVPDLSQGDVQVKG